MTTNLGLKRGKVKTTHYDHYPKTKKRERGAVLVGGREENWAFDDFPKSTDWAFDDFPKSTDWVFDDFPKSTDWVFDDFPKSTDWVFDDFPKSTGFTKTKER